MKKGGSIVCVIILLFVGLAISPATGSIFEAGEKNFYNPLGDEEVVTVYFWDCTGKRLERTVTEFSESEWNNLREQISEIKATSESFEEAFDSQFDLFKEYNLIDYDITYEILEEKAMDEFKDKNPRPPRQSPIDNVIINAVCAIMFELTDGNTFVFGLNTFINLVGFDIISFHKGYATDGIFTLGGLLAQSADPGEYIGFMFGFLGYWFGTKTGTGTYSDLIVSGFTVTTTWLPLPSR